MYVKEILATKRGMQFCLLLVKSRIINTTGDLFKEEVLILAGMPPATIIDAPSGSPLHQSSTIIDVRVVS